MVPAMSDDKANNDNRDGDLVSFGFRDVKREDRQKLVQDVFTSVARQYDVMNDLMSAGVHRAWKSAMLDWLNPRPGRRYLDVAGGTGDIAMGIIDRCHGDCDVTVLDYTPNMLIEGRRRAAEDGFDASTTGDLSWTAGDAQHLPLPDSHYHGYTIAFGIRNVTDIPKALREAHRVLKPGGHFMCLEFSHVPDGMLRAAYDAWSFRVIPEIGERVTGDRGSYDYLVESIRKFPLQDDFAAMIEDAGFQRVSYRNLTQGVAAIHSGWKI